MNLRNVSVFHMFRCFSKNTKVAASLRLYYKDMQWHDGTLARYCTTQLIISGNTAIPQVELFIDADCSILAFQRRLLKLRCIK